MPAMPAPRGALVQLLLLADVAGALRLDASEGSPPRYQLLREGAAGPETPAEQPAAPTAAACVPLTNRGSHYTVRVTVGTPPQRMDLLVDTGSDAVIANSCQCKQTKGCTEEEKCYSPHRSSTFNQSHVFHGHANNAVMMFGSGMIKTKVGSDVVRVGKVSAELAAGLFMLVERKLNIDAAFEGLLGLGPPHEKLPNETHQFAPYGFLEAAGIDRFSICLNRGGRGFLRLGTAAVPDALGSSAKAHWGVNFRGVSVGSWHVKSFCSTPDSPCGAMPDSGTTLIAAPKEHLKDLFSHICEHWPRCNRTFHENFYHTENMWFNFERLLVDCHDWAGLPGTELNTSAINEELPHLRFVVAGKDGKQQKLRLLGEDYLAHMLSATHLAAAPHWLGGALPYQGTRRKVCSPAFHSMNTTSANMGKIWILGLPILNKFQVHYDRGTQPPSMAFASGPCDGCDELRLSTESAERSEGDQGLLWLDEPPRLSPFLAEGL